MLNYQAVPCISPVSKYDKNKYSVGFYNAGAPMADLKVNCSNERDALIMQDIFNLIQTNPTAREVYKQSANKYYSMTDENTNRLALNSVADRAVLSYNGYMYRFKRLNQIAQEIQQKQNQNNKINYQA